MAKSISPSARNMAPPDRREHPAPRHPAPAPFIELPDKPGSMGTKGKGRANLGPHHRPPRRTARKRKGRRNAFQRKLDIKRRRFDKLPRFDQVQILLRQESMRRHVERAGRTVPDSVLHAKARFQWESAVDNARRRAKRFQNPNLAESLPDLPLVLQAAIRRDPAMARIAALLASQRDGRPTDRRLAVEVLMRNACDELPIEYRRALMDFLVCAPALEWAFGEPYLPASLEPLDEVGRKRLERLTVEQIQGRKECPSPEGEEVRTPGVLDLHDPDIVLDEIAGAYLRLGAIRDGEKHPGVLPFGSVWGLDGTWLQVNREQMQSFSLEHEALLQAGLPYGFTRHDKQSGSVRGANGLILTEVMRDPVAAGMSVNTAEIPEARFAAELVDSTLKRLIGRNPGFAGRTQVVLADRHFFEHKLTWHLLSRWSIALIVPWQGGDRRVAWGDNMGVPYCAKHPLEREPEPGEEQPQDAEQGTVLVPRTVDMRLEGARGVWTMRDRLKKGVPLGEPLEDHLRPNELPHLRWVCPECEHLHATEGWPKPKPVTTWPHKDAAHIYTWHPHKRVVLNARRMKELRGRRAPIEIARWQERMDLQGLRGASESLNAVLKHDCYGLKAPKAPRCIQTERQMLWWAYLRNLRNLLKVLVRLDGGQERVRREMTELGLLTPGLLARMRAMGMTPASFAGVESALAAAGAEEGSRRGLYAVAGGGEGDSVARGELEAVSGDAARSEGVGGAGVDDASDAREYAA